MRIPSVGQTFVLKGYDFEVVKSKGRIITLKGKQKGDKFEIINPGAKFTLFKTFFKSKSFRISDGKVNMTAIGVKEAV